MKRAVLLLLVIGCAAACSPPAERGAPADPAALQASVESLLTVSAEAWNGGDLEGFLYWYKSGPETSFMTSRGPVHGLDELRGVYASRFEPGASRDSLRFEDIETRPLAPWLGLATARCVLFQGDSITDTCVFTLVLENAPEGWRIIHDHSSAASN
jgi:ketosteroid isomerase-like protein